MFATPWLSPPTQLPHFSRVWAVSLCGAPSFTSGCTGTTTAGTAARSRIPACSCTTCWPLVGENPRQNTGKPQNRSFYTHIPVRNQAVLRNCYSPVYFLQTSALKDTPSVSPFVILRLISLMPSPGAEKSTSDPSQKASGLVTVVSLFILFILTMFLFAWKLGLCWWLCCVLLWGLTNSLIGNKLFSSVQCKEQRNKIPRISTQAQ